MDPLFDFTGKVVLVTGGSRGLGYQMVKAFATRGADVIIASRKLENCEKVAQECRALGRRAMAFSFHAGRWADCDALIAAAYAEFGRFDVLVNNAGMSPACPSHELPESLFDSVLNLNFKGPFRLASQFGTSISTVFSTRSAIEELVRRADLLIGTVLVPGAAAPKLVTRDMLKTMKPGSVIVDVAIDQGGCVETSHATTHADPTYVVDGVVHYCVANMPGAVARTSTFALNSVTLPFTLALADKGWRKALEQDPHLREGLNVCEGKLTCEPVAEAHGLAYTSAESVLGL
ncbi:MAG TPA: SDR family NAD(P)-dependent oxidoreductase [Thermomonas sp.]|nr:SDR family NAD(P)-dependent oxidoreductase [Thermomonas sp.]